MNLILGKEKTDFYLEPEAFEGVRRIADKVAGDVEAVTGMRPEVTDAWHPSVPQVIVCATAGRSPLADRLADAGILCMEKLQGKREVYQIALAVIEGRNALIICGSDKRGTIYGMFALSEYIGVSPLCFWGDVTPVRRSEAVITESILTVSSEPSVKYRGFFINDEWPCFGNWAVSHYGDVNAECYDLIFELLLRLKGNFLWPAMWNSSFPLDGPDSANEELADLYGVIMGYSHHEPCLRASEEWDKVRGEDSIYGNAWNYKTNEAGLLRYWQDALQRSGKYENLITIGMRGERDSTMLGEDSSLKENISLLKKIIVAQRDLIRQTGNADKTLVLALYKEVEKYFVGDADTEGLNNWEELEDVLFLLCEDNFGHLRTVPPDKLRDHPGGWGMYYHFDYHGDPVSFEWVDSTPLSQTWEQMTQAWEYGIRDLWIVNVGDLKLHEIPLSYFLALAYDYDKWGSGSLHSPQEYLQEWCEKTFPRCDAPLRAEIGDVFTQYIAMNSLRRPEALHPYVYHPCHYEETERMLRLASGIEAKSDSIMERLPAQERDAYYSMIHFPAMASANLVKLHLFAGKNQHYAAQGSLSANRWAEEAEACILRDRALANEFAAFLGGKWAGMQLAPHIGFTKWKEDDCRYPVLCKVTPVNKPVMKVSRADSEKTAAKNYGSPVRIAVDDFLYAGCDCVTLEVKNGGSPAFTFNVIAEDGKALPPWLSVSPLSGTVEDTALITLRCERQLLPPDRQCVTLIITDGDARVAVDVSAKAVCVNGLPPMTFLENKGVISILAEHFSTCHDTEKGGYRRIADYGKYGSGMKVLPSVLSFPQGTDRPELSYSFLIPAEGEYTAEILTAPLNPVHKGERVELLLKTEEEGVLLELIPEDFRAGENSDSRWAEGVLSQIHTAAAKLHFAAGVQTLTVGAVSPGVVLEKIVLRAPGVSCPEAYLGPEESFHTPQGS